jgi:hypothetical protein
MWVPGRHHDYEVNNSEQRRGPELLLQEVR